MKKEFKTPFIFFVIFIFLLIVSLLMVSKKEHSVTTSGLFFKPINKFKTIEIPAENKQTTYIINFWATWCGPCLIEIPELMKLTEKFKDMPIKIIGVSVDMNESDVLAFLDKRPISYPIVMENNQIYSYFGQITAVPTTFILNYEGQIIKKFMGFQPISVLESYISDAY